MKTLKRNQQTFYYALLTGTGMITESGTQYKTGERGKMYSEPVEMKANISPSRGYADMEIFGKDLDYTRTICTDDLSCPITEESILWIDKEPFDHLGNASSYNNIVTQIAKSLNNIVYAVRKVNVN